MAYGWNSLKASMMLVTSQHLVLWADLLLRYQRIDPQWSHIGFVHLKWPDQQLRTHISDSWRFAATFPSSKNMELVKEFLSS